MPQPPVLPWSVGRNDNAWPTGDGGGPNTSFVQENGAINPLPGVPNSPEIDQQADNDYYFAGIYSTVIPGNGDYQPVGDVRARTRKPPNAPLRPPTMICATTSISRARSAPIRRSRSASIR